MGTMDNQNNKSTRKRIAFAQNFIKDKALVAKLLNDSSITDKDVVYEIGPGQGIITEQLLRVSAKVVAYEIDNNLYSKLKDRYIGGGKLELNLGDFMDCSLPAGEYKVFSNIPFNISSAVIKKLTHAVNPPVDTYLIMQKEAAAKMIGRPLDSKYSQIATLLYPWFDISVMYSFKNNDFFPAPKVDTLLIRISKRARPLIGLFEKKLFDDFVVYTYSQFKPNVFDGLASIFGAKQLSIILNKIGIPDTAKPTEIEPAKWLDLFNSFMNGVDRFRQRKVDGSADKLAEQQAHLEKIHRTSLDKDWVKYK